MQPADLLAGVLDFLRDAMVLAVGAGSVLLAVTPRQKPRLQGIVDRWSIDAILAALQILAEARARMRGVSHGRLLVELALVRVARLENLSDLSELVARLAALESGSPLPHQKLGTERKKKADAGCTDRSTEPRPPASRAGSPAAGDRRLGSREHARRSGSRRDARPTVEGQAPIGPAGEARCRPRAATRRRRPTRADAAEAPAAAPSAPATARPPLELAPVRQVWPELVKKVGVELGMRLSQAEPIGVEEPDVLVIAAKPGYNARGRCVRHGRGPGEDRTLPAEAASPARDRPLSSGRSEPIAAGPARARPASPAGRKCWRPTRWSRRSSSCSRPVPSTWSTTTIPTRIERLRAHRDREPARSGSPVGDGFADSFLWNKEGQPCSVNWEIWPT